MAFGVRRGPAHSPLAPEGAMVTAMRALMDLLCDYLTLAAQRATGQPLDEAQQHHWLGLQRVLPGAPEGAPPTPPQGPDDESDEDGTLVELTTDGGFGTARLIAVSREGMRLRSRLHLPVGARTVVRVVLGRAEVEYTFPCVVAWRTAKSVGLAFDGAPLRVDLRHTLRRGWQSPLALRTGWGPRPAVAVA